VGLVDPGVEAYPNFIQNKNKNKLNSLPVLVVTIFLVSDVTTFFIVQQKTSRRTVLLFL